MCRPLFTPILARLRSIGGRSRRMEHQLYRVSDQLTRMEIIMTQTKSELLAKIAEVQAAVDAERKTHADDIANAVAKAKAAWEADNQDEHDAAMAGLDGLINSLKNPSPVFEPSGN